MLLTTYRPGYRPPWVDKSYATQLALPRLTRRESQRVVQSALHTAPIAETLFLSYGAVEKNVTSIFGKLGLPQDAGDHRRVLAVLRYLKV